MSKILKSAGAYAIVLGITMIGWWTLVLLNDQMPELHTAPAQALGHLAAEYLTGLFLLAGGYGLLTGQPWGGKLHLVSLGMMLYAVVQALGYYANQGGAIMFGMFMAFTVATLTFVGLYLRERAQRLV